MCENFTRIKDLFTEDFFIKLKSFIFEEDFETFFKRRTAEKRNYTSLDNRFWIPEVYIEDFVTTKDYPITYEHFFDMYKTIGSCAKIIDTKLFYIKILVKLLFESKESKDFENFSINLKKNIITDFYEEKIEQELYNSSFQDLESLDISINKFLHFKFEKSYDIYFRDILLSVFEIIQAHLETIAINLSKDITSIIDSYSFETREKMLYPYLCNKKENTSYLNNLIKSAKQIRISRLNSSQGRNQRNFLGDIPKDYLELKNDLKKYKTSYKKYKKEVEHYIKQAIPHALKIERKNLQDKFIDYLTSNVDARLTELLIYYFDLKCSNRIATLEEAYLYMLLEKSGNLIYYEHSDEPEKAFKQFLKRNKDNTKFFQNRPFPKLYLSEEFINLKRRFFDI